VITADKRFQFYGRRKGKSLRRHHSALMDELLPQLRVAPDNPLAGVGARRWLETGFGSGDGRDTTARGCQVQGALSPAWRRSRAGQFPEP